MWLPRKGNEGEDLPNELQTLATYVPVTTLKNVQTVYVDENCSLLNGVIKWQKKKKEKGTRGRDLVVLLYTSSLHGA